MITPQIICNVIQNYMGLSDDQIWIYNQRKKIPASEGLFVTVAMLSRRPYGNINHLTGSDDSLTQEIGQYMQEILSINIFSYDTEAVERLPELIGSFKTVYAQQMQEKYAFQIGAVPAEVSDTSYLETSAILFRQTITLKVLRAYSKITDAQFYDKFETEIYNQSGKVTEWQ
jgi:hypothetical protein